VYVPRALGTEIEPVVKLPPPSACAFRNSIPSRVTYTVSSWPKSRPLKSTFVPVRTVIVGGLTTVLVDVAVVPVDVALVAPVPVLLDVVAVVPVDVAVPAPVPVSVVAVVVPVPGVPPVLVPAT
jgi:hypothetical protein